MTEMLEIAKNWFLGLGDQYGVNPIIFGCLYVLSIPPYVASIGWVVRNYRKNRPLSVPVLSTLFFFGAPSMYLLLAGENVPWWFYALIGFMIVYGAYTTYRKIRKRVNKAIQNDEFKVRV